MNAQSWTTSLFMQMHSPKDGAHRRPHSAQLPSPYCDPNRSRFAPSLNSPYATTAELARMWLGRLDMGHALRVTRIGCRAEAARAIAIDVHDSIHMKRI
jgi:hypothetical protein